MQSKIKEKRKPEVRGWNGKKRWKGKNKLKPKAVKADLEARTIVILILLLILIGIIAFALTQLLKRILS